MTMRANRDKDKQYNERQTHREKTKHAQNKIYFILIHSKTPFKN